MQIIPQAVLLRFVKERGEDCRKRGIGENFIVGLPCLNDDVWLFHLGIIAYDGAE